MLPAAPISTGTDISRRARRITFPRKRVSFLAQLYYTLYSLPGGEKPNHELRRCLGEFLHDYPESTTNPLASLKKFMDTYKQWSHEWLYEGDLERDFLHTLGEIQKAAKEDPVGVEVDFRV